jgi:hypothetical protein
MLLLSSFLLFVAGATVVACVIANASIQTVAGILAVAGVLLFPDGLLLLVFEVAVACNPAVIGFLLLMAFLLLLASLLIRPCYSWWLYILDCTMVHITISIGLLFFLLSNYRNIENRIGKFKKLLDYRISDLSLNLSDYRISDSEKIIDCPPMQFGCRFVQPLTFLLGPFWVMRPNIRPLGNTGLNAFLSPTLPPPTPNKHTHFCPPHKKTTFWLEHVVL